LPEPAAPAVSAAAKNAAAAPANLLDAVFNLPPLRAVFRRLPDGTEGVLVPLIKLLVLLLLFVGLRWLIGRVVGRTIRALVEREQGLGNEGRAARIRTLASLTKSVVFYTLAFVFVVAALGTLGFNLAGVLGTAGVAGLAVGFGAQKLVKDVITGFFLLLEDQYAVGDYVTIGSVTGTVEELGMRITRLRDDDGRLYILSNGDIAQVCNMSRGPLAGVLEVAVAASADVGRATEVLNAAFAQAAERDGLELAEPARVEGVAAVDAAKTVLRVRFRAKENGRPGDAALRLREAARVALRDAEIALA